MPRFRIGATWQMYGEYEVEAESLAEAKRKVEDQDPGFDELPDGEYVDDSFVLNTDCCEQIED